MQEILDKIKKKYHNENAVPCADGLNVFLIVQQSIENVDEWSDEELDVLRNLNVNPNFQQHFFYVLNK